MNDKIYRFNKKYAVPLMNIQNGKVEFIHNGFVIRVVECDINNIPQQTFTGQELAMFDVLVALRRAVSTFNSNENTVAITPYLEELFYKAKQLVSFDGALYINTDLPDIKLDGEKL